ncbi:MAG: peptidoglycan editing factor PgeF [Chlorobi bacterium]|nr:peptidoglycan editing factor PgeF [Chlorobiota bacterium]
MKIIQSNLFNSIPEITFGLSTKSNQSSDDPFGFNLSFNIGDDEKRVLKNREQFFNELGLTSEQVAYHYQMHGDTIKVVNEAGFVGESDALVTTRKNLGLAITTADCTTIFIYDRIGKIISGVHSGWRGTTKNILGKTLKFIEKEFNSKPNDLLVYIAPSISQKNYEVGEEVAEHFDPKYRKKHGDKFLLDVSAVNYDILIEHGIPENQIEKSTLCSFDSQFLHSYRRDGNRSGRALGVIAMKE